MGDRSRSLILLRRSRFVAAALASAGVAQACHAERPVSTVTTLASASTSPATTGSGGPLDRDGDGILDKDDKCPNAPGPAPEGCPKPCLMIVPYAAIQINARIFFANGSAKLRPASMPILDDIAQVMIGQPKLVVEVQGHADKSEANAHVLSKQRAAAVRDALIQRGVSDLRLSAVAYGIQMPFGDPKTAEGREQNRRVSFKVVDGG